MNIQRPAYNMTPPSQFPFFFFLEKTTQNMLNYIQDHKVIPHFSYDELQKNSSLIFKQIWYSTSTTAAVIRNCYPESTKNNVKLISWSYYFTTDHTTFYQTGHKNSVSHNIIYLHKSFMCTFNKTTIFMP